MFVLLAMRRRAAGNDFAENPTAFLGRALVALILAVTGMSMSSGLGAHWSLLPERAAEEALSRLLLTTQVFCVLAMLFPGAVTILGGNPSRAVLRAFPLRPLQSFIADFLACLLDAPAAVAAAAMLPFVCHLLLGGEWLQALAAVVVFALLGVQTCALVRLLIDGAALSARRVRRWAEIPALTGLLLVCLCGAVPPAFASLTTAKHQHPGAVHVQLPSLPSIDPSPVLPSTYAGNTLLSLRQGNLPRAVGSLVLLAVLSAVTLGAAYGASRSAAYLPADRRTAARSPATLPASLPSAHVPGASPAASVQGLAAPGLRLTLPGMGEGPVAQFARLVVTELRLLVRKPESYLPLRQPAAMLLLGALAFLSPDMGKDPVYSFKELLGLGGVAYNVLWQMQLLCNRFGSESGTGALLFSLSVPRVRLFLVKNIALLLLLLAVDSIALSALCFVAEAPQNIPTFLFWQCLALIVITALGSIVSVLQPFSIARHDSRNKEDAPDGLAAAYVAVGTATWLLLWPVAGIAGRGLWGAAFAFAYALLLYVVGLYAATAILKRNERLVIARLDRSDN